jgi:hypothetical protein
MLHANYFLPFLLHFLQNIFSDISQKDLWLHQKGIHKEGQLRRRPDTVAELSEETFGTFGIWKKNKKNHSIILVFEKNESKQSVTQLDIIAARHPVVAFSAETPLTLDCLDPTINKE